MSEKKNMHGNKDMKDKTNVTFMLFTPVKG